MTDRSIFIRLGVRDADQAVRELEKFGDRGGRAVKSIENATKPAGAALRTLDRSVGQLGDGFRSLAGRAGPAGAVLGGLGPAGLAAAAGIGAALVALRQFNQAVSEADQLQKFADRIGVGVEQLQELRFAAERTGVAAGNLDTGLQRFTRRMAEAAVGTGELKNVLDQYGIAARNADGTNRNNLEVLGELADVIAGTTDQSERLRIAVKAFDQEGAGLVNLLGRGSAGMAELRDRARELGVVLSEDTTREAERARDALDEAGQVIEVNLNRVLLDLAPIAIAASSALAGVFAFFSDGDEGGGVASTVPAISEKIEALSAELKVAEGELRNMTGEYGDAAEAAAAYRTKVENLRVTLSNLRADLKLITASSEGASAPGADAVVSASAIREAKAALAELRQEYDETLKLEAERAEALQEFAEISNTLTLTEAERAEQIDTINRHYDERLAKLNDDTKATADAKREADALARTLAGLNTKVDQLDASYSPATAALIDYRQEVEVLNEALRAGVLDEQEHSDRIDRAAAAYDRAARSASSYAGISRQAAVAPAGLDFASLARSGVSAAASGGFDPSSLLGSVGLKFGSSVLDSMIDGSSFIDAFTSPVSAIARSFSSGFSGVSASIASGLANIAPGIGNAIASSIGVAQGLGPAGLVTGGLGPGGAGGAVSSAALAQAGFSAVIPGIGIALAGLALLGTKIFGGGKSTGPAIGASFDVDDGALFLRDYGANNGADEAAAKDVGDTVVNFVNQLLSSTGATLKHGAFWGEVGYANGRYASNPRNIGIDRDAETSQGDAVRTFGSIDEAVGDFIGRGLREAIAEGAVEGLSAGTADLISQVMARLELEGGASAEDVGGALNFAVEFSKMVEDLGGAGDRAAQQLHALGNSAEAFGDVQKETVESFKAQVERFFGEAATTVNVDGNAPVDAGGRISVRDLEALIDGREGGRIGFSFGGQDFRRVATGEDGRGGVGFKNLETGEIIDAIQDVDGNLSVLAASIGAVGDSIKDVVDPGDPARLAEGMAALETYIDSVLGLVQEDDTGVLTGFALVLEEGLLKVDAMRVALEAFGFSAEVVEQKLADAAARLTERTVEDFDQAIADQILSLTDPLKLQLDALAEAEGILIEEARAVGADVDQVRRLFDLRETELTGEAPTGGYEPGSIADYREQIRLTEQAIDLRKAEVAALQQSVDGVGAFVSRIRFARGDLQLLSASPLSPGLRLEEARRQFAAAVALAQEEVGTGGPQTDRALELSRQVVELARDQFASGPEFVSIFNSVDQALAGLESAGDADLSLQRGQLDALLDLNENGLTQIGLLEQAIAALEDQASGSGGGGSGAGAGTGGGSPGVGAGAAVNATTGALQSIQDDIRANGAAGVVARAQAYLANNPDVAAAAPPGEELSFAITHYRDFGQFEDRPEFADGGFHDGGLRIVGERGPELEATGPARIYSAQQTAAMLGQAGDGGETASLLAVLVEEMRGLRGDLNGALRAIARALAGRADDRLSTFKVPAL